MIIGLGIDTIEIARFAQWHTFSPKTVTRIFSVQEIDYCLQSPSVTAERFAARFATREAFFKAIQSAYPQTRIPFLSICRLIEVTAALNGSPQLVIDWKRIATLTNHEIQGPMPALLSLTHDRSVATAIVFLQR